VAQSNTFRFVDIRLTLDLRDGTVGRAAADNSPFVVRDAVESDIQALRELARAGHRDSRFYYDGNFSMQQCNALYEAWIEKSCRGWAQKVLVADRGGGAEGYVTCHISDPANGQIGLVGVGEKARGLGMGRYLVCDAIQWFAQEGIGNITVATQGRNVSAQRLYQRCGFVTRSVELWFHKWFTESGRDE
jgi:GNAT superfamily N-acetyltransferase